MAETLDEFRGQPSYNLWTKTCGGWRRSAADLAVGRPRSHQQLVGSKDLSADARYTEKHVPLLIGRATRAFLEYAPMRWHTQESPNACTGTCPSGRCWTCTCWTCAATAAATPSTGSRSRAPTPLSSGRAQIEWLKSKLAASRATWKVIAADMPLGLVVGDGTDAAGAPSLRKRRQRDGPPLGREFEIAELLAFIKQQRIGNVVWLTADVHYCAAHHYDPSARSSRTSSRSGSSSSGPLNAGSFGPDALDNTFGPQVVFQKAPPAPNTSPSPGCSSSVKRASTMRPGDDGELKDLDGTPCFPSGCTRDSSPLSGKTTEASA